MKWLTILFFALLVTAAVMFAVEKVFLLNPFNEPRSQIEWSTPSDATRQSASLFALLSQPQSFHGRRVLTSGYIVIEFEHAALYIDKDATTAGLQQNGVWIEPPLSVQRPEMKRLSREYVTVEGTFDALESGYGHYSSTLKEISLISPLFSEPAYETMMVGSRHIVLFSAVRQLLNYVMLGLFFTIVSLGAFKAIRGMDRSWIR
jgi:hypothetical protein